MRYGVCLESDYKSKIMSAAKNYDLIVIDAQDYTAAEIKKMKVAGTKKILSYINIGAIEDDRAYFQKAQKAGLVGAMYDNWPGEYWIRANKTGWKDIILQVADDLLAKGVDGFWADNLDIYHQACDAWKWSAADCTATYANLLAILQSLHAKGYVMTNGGDVFVRKLLQDGKKHACIDAVNQETVFSGIKSYDPPGVFCDQDYEDEIYYKWYIEMAAGRGKDVFLLEYTKDKAVISKAQKYCEEKGFSMCISGNVELGADISSPIAPAQKYEISGTGVPSKKAIKTGILKKSMKVTARLQPVSGAAPCSFSPVKGLTKIDVCDTITDADGVKWDYCCVNGKYGFILTKSISSYVRTGGQTIAKVAQWAIDGDFGNDDIRISALKTLGYDVDTVQTKVNEILGKSSGDHPRIRIYPVWFFEGDESRFGDCTAIIEYAADDKTVAHCILIDTACASAVDTVVAKLKTQGVKEIDLVIISHAHGDHYGGLTGITKKIPVKAVYVPDCTGLDKHQKSYGNALRRQAAKAETSRILKTGGTFQIGRVKGTCLYQAPADKLSEHDNHHFVNNQSMAIRFTLDGVWALHSAGDMQNEANNLMIKAVSDLHADIYKCQWHGDANACNEAICKAVRPTIAFSNYHHVESKGGRGTTRKRLEAVGATVARNAENGDIYIDCQGETMKLSCSKGNLTKSFRR